MKHEGKGLHHRYSIWNTLCIHANSGAFITGIGTYTEDFEDLFNASLNITFDRYILQSPFSNDFVQTL